MTYDEFLNIPVSVLRDLETILLLKSQYQLETTSQEREIYEHLIKFHDEQRKSYELRKQKRQLEKLLKL
jgi:hypothetical protein